MPIENFEEEGLEKIPDLRLPQWAFQYKCNVSNKEPIKIKLLEAVVANDMAPYYELICQDLNLNIDNNLLEKMKLANVAKLKELDDNIKNAEDNHGDTEVREAMITKAHYLSKIGDRPKALEQFNLILEKSLMLGYRLDLTFHLIRIGFFFNDRKLITKNIEKANNLMEEGGDWDRRNRLKVYKGLYSLSIREFANAANHFLEAVATFTSYELMDYKTFIIYTILTSMISLKRSDLKDKVVRGSEILEVLHGLPSVKEYLNSFYECRYADFFVYLAGIENYMKIDAYLCPHYRYYIREMRILAYKQHLESYSSLSVLNMSKLFGVTVDFLDKELSRFIANGRLACKIDQVNGIIEATRPDSINSQYQSVIKHGDILLNRIQKLSRVINI